MAPGSLVSLQPSVVLGTRGLQRTTRRPQDSACAFSIPRPKLPSVQWAVLSLSARRVSEPLGPRPRQMLPLPPYPQHLTAPGLTGRVCCRGLLIQYYSILSLSPRPLSGVCL